MDDPKVIILLGARQVGKTTLLQSYANGSNSLWLNGDAIDVRESFSEANLSKLKMIIGDHNLIIIDEAQRIPNIGIVMKLLYDNLKDVKIIASGSSAFELSNKSNEPLTGRKWEYQMHALSVEEMIDHHGFLEEQRLLEHRMTYGFYPDVINSPGKEKDILQELSDSYLYKDLLAWGGVKKPIQLEKLLQALAFQIGSQVSYHELGQMAGLNNETVERYIDLLNKSFIVFTLSSLSRNLRNELKKSKKIYFYDLGVRNAVIKNYNSFGLRNDVGALWENFLIVERMKHKSYNKKHTNDYFWRTHAQQEIDYVEEHGGKMHAYEFKFGNKRKARITKTFLNAYPEHEAMIVTKDNYLEFIQE